MATFTSEELNAIAQAPMSSIDSPSDAPRVGVASPLENRIPSPLQAYSTPSVKYSPKPSKPKHAAIAILNETLDPLFLTSALSAPLRLNSLIFKY